MAVYLLRFDRPLVRSTGPDRDPERPGAHASYYIGSTPDARLVQRLTEHWQNSDACIVRAARSSGRRFRPVRVWWEKGHPFERKLKKAGAQSLPHTRCGVRHDPAPPPRSLPRTRSGDLFPIPHRHYVCPHYEPRPEDDEVAAS